MVSWMSVHLADNEWSSHEEGQIMLNVARKTAAERPDKWPLKITVHEHGGWWLSYFFDEQHNGLIVGTANDAARLSDAALAVAEKYKGSKVEYIGSVRR